MYGSLDIYGRYKTTRTLRAYAILRGYNTIVAGWQGRLAGWQARQANLPCHNLIYHLGLVIIY